MKKGVLGFLIAAAFVSLGDVNLPNTSTIADIQAAIDSAQPGEVITLADGTYAFDQALTVNKGITLTGSHRDKCILQGSGTVDFETALTISDKDACVKNLTISEFTSSAWYNYHGAGVRINAGTLTQARVTRCKATGGNRAAGVSMEGTDNNAAFLTYCIIDHNEANAAHGTGGVRFLNKCNTMANCLVWANKGSGDYGSGGISVINVTAWSPFKIVNCTVVGNSATKKGGGIALSSANVSDDAAIVNTIIADNTAPEGGDIYIGDNMSKTGYNCLCPTQTYGKNPQTGDPLFADAANGDFHLLPDSPARNTGDKDKAASVLGYDLAETLDFYETARVLENQVDIGCSEYEKKPDEDADKLMVLSLPQAYGAADPAYGQHSGYVAGQQYTLTAPASWTSDDGLTRAVCTNCTVAKVGGDVIVSKSFTGAGDTRSITYTHPVWNDGAEAVWLWETQNKVTVTTSEGGTVSSDEAWVALGDDFTVTATADDGYCFYRWVDNETEEALGFDSTLALTVERPRDISAEFISSSVIPYDSSVVDYAPIIGAVVKNVAAGAVVTLEEGVYLLAAPLVVDKAITLQGAENGGSVLKATYKCNAQNSSALTVSGGATISRVAITGGLSDNVWQAFGVGVTISSGTLSECAVTNNVYAATGNEQGVGVYAPVSGGATVTITHCKICDNTSSASFNSTKGVGLYVEGNSSSTFLMDNCLVSGNTSTSGNTGTANCSGGGLWIKHDNAKIVNCTFTGNHHNNRGGGVYIDGGKPKFANCIIAGNTAGNDEDTSDYKPDISGNISTDITGGSFNNLVSTGVTVFGTDGLAEDPLFETGSYQLQFMSPARNTGNKDKTLSELGCDLGGMLDFYGVPRVLENQVDIGCAEFVPDIAICAIAKSADSIYQGKAITLTGSSIGFGDVDDIVYTWTIMRNESEDEPVVMTGAQIVLTPETTGTYEVNLTASSEETRKSADADPTTFIVKDPPMFYVGEQGYDTWLDAYNAAPDGGTIKVGANAKIGGNTVNKSFTFDLCGQTLRWESGWMCYTYHVIDTGTPAGSGRFELAAGSGNNNNIGSATLDLSALAADQFAASSRFWTNAGTTILFPADMPLKTCNAMYANKIDGEKLVAQGVSYIYNAAKGKWKREIPLGLMIMVR